MANFQRGKYGIIEDAVRVELGGSEVLAVEEYSVSVAFLQVPNVFEIVVGSGGTAVDLMRRFPPNTPFRLFIGDVVQFSGRTDGFSRGGGDATTVVLTGRDCMAPLVDSCVEHDRSFNHATFEQLTRFAIQDAGIAGYSLTYDAAAQRAAIAGTPITETTDIERPASVNDLLGLSVSRAPGQDLNVAPLAIEPPTIKQTITKITGFRANKPIQIKAGTTQIGWLKKEIERGGLFLRAGVDPMGVDEFVFVLSEPSAKQGALYGLVATRAPFEDSNLVNLLPPRLTNLTTGRHAKYVVYGRGGGGADGTKGVVGSFIDQDMLAMGFSMASKRWVAHEDDVQSAEHATFLARRQCAMERRTNRTFTYPFRGHTLPMLKAPEQRAVVVPDTNIYLRDDEHGIEGVFWIERCHYRGTKSGRITEMTLMLPDDLVFGDGNFDRLRHGKHRHKLFGTTTTASSVDLPTALPKI